MFQNNFCYCIFNIVPLHYHVFFHPTYLKILDLHSRNTTKEVLLSPYNFQIRISKKVHCAHASRKLARRLGNKENSWEPKIKTGYLKRVLNYFVLNTLGWFKAPVSSQTHKLMAATNFSDYLGLNHYKKAEKNKTYHSFKVD